MGANLPSIASLILLLACSPAPGATSQEERTVFASTGGRLCSLTLRRSHDGRRWDPDSLGEMLDIVDHVRGRNPDIPDIRATYLDLKSSSSLTITSAGDCEDSPKWVEDVRSEARTMQLEVSSPFLPRMVSSESATVTAALKSLAGPEASIEDCSIAMRLNPSADAEADRSFTQALMKARDVYGIPILFSSQQDNVMYLTVHRGCDQKERVYEALRLSLARTPGQHARLVSFTSVSRDALREAYGAVF